MRHRQRGGVMVLVMIVLAGVMAVLALALARQNLEFRAANQRSDSARARLAAQSGLQYAVAVLQAQPTAPVSQDDEWYVLGDNADERFMVGDVSFRMQVVDAAGLVNLNSASEQQLSGLGLTTEQVDSLLDWREDGFNARPEGAKDDYYSTLTNPYNAKLRRMDTLDELLLVKGFDSNTLLQAPQETPSSGITPVPLYALATVDSFSPNTGATGQSKVNINQATQQQLQQAGVPAQVAAAIIATRQATPFASMGDVLRVVGMTNEAAAALLAGFALDVSPRLEGKINLNTASESVLQSLPNITPDVVSGILSRQPTGMQDLSEALQIPGLTIATLADIVDSITTSSDTFLVRVEGLAGSSRYSLEGVVRVTGTSARIVKVLDPPRADMRELWGWAEQTTTETVLGEAQ